MLIRETIDRECCQPSDLKEIVGLDGKPNGRHWFFCKHCGRHFEDEGGSEPESPGIQPLPWPWEVEQRHTSTTVRSLITEHPAQESV